MLAAERRSPSRIAWHEAGHAIAALQLGLTLHYASIKANDHWSTGGADGCLAVDWYGSAGHAMVQWPGSDVDLEPWVVILLAAGAAERRQFGEGTYGSRDMKEARTIVRLLDVIDPRHFRVPSEAEIDAAMEPYRQKADRVVADHWGWIARVAAELDKITGLTASEIRALKAHDAAERVA